MPAMALNWIDTTQLSFNNLLLLERVQISWLAAGSVAAADLALALQANPVVAWYLRHKCPEAIPWLDEVEALPVGEATPEAVCAAEQRVLQRINDWLVYAIDPAIYDAQPFLAWDSGELSGLVDFRDKLVLDIGAGTGRLAQVALPLARVVWAVEPVASLRDYMRAKFNRQGYSNFYAVDGLITAIPFPTGFADVVMGGHVFGDVPDEEQRELERVTRPGGMVILCPGNGDRDDAVHQALVEGGYHWSRFEEPCDGWRRKYWKVLPE